MEVSRYFADLHPRLVPFPIVLLLAGLVLDACGWMFRHRAAAWAGKVLTIAGTVTLLAAFVCGICAEIWAGRSGVPHHQIKWHELAATVAAWGFIFLCAWRLFLDDGARHLVNLLYLACGFALYGMMAATGYLGGKLVTEYGASVDGARALSVLSMHDLNTLAQRQTDRNLEYSDLMHHAAGWFVVALTMAIFVRELQPRHASKVRWVPPALFVIGGVLLFFTADLDLYAFSDPRQWYDREVQAHKLISLLLVIVGLRSLWRTFKSPAAPSTEPSAATARFQNRLIAVFALIGGGLLFTHVHTVAPYANVAAGVYANHVVMGIVALLIGGVKLLDEASPQTHSRIRALAFPILLSVEAFLLVTYTEGLPWFIGYGHYNRWGPSDNAGAAFDQARASVPIPICGFVTPSLVSMSERSRQSGLASVRGTIAPYGDVRAELTFEPISGQMNVRVFDRFTATPVTVEAARLNAIISVGYQQTSVPLMAVDFKDGRASHFRGEAEFLKHANYFDARLDLPINGKMRIGRFDPWVIPAITGIPPNILPRYACPMHEGVRREEPGACPLCGVSLIPIQTAIRTTLHDEKYAMDFAPETAAAGQTVTLRFTPKLAVSGETMRSLQIVHEYPLHLIVVGDDLRYFDHVHPVLQADGSLTLDYAFPKDGRYLLFADISPRGDRAQVFRLPVVVGSAPPSAAVTLVPEAATSREIGRYHVELFTQPRELVSGRECHIGYRLELDGRPVTDLEPYIGAMGHCVIISEDTQMYLHSHPQQFAAAPLPSERGGPEVAFHTVFPHPGRYKVWGQFKRGGEIVIADFVLDVKKPLVPKWMSDFLIFD